MEANETEFRENQSGFFQCFRRIVPHCFSDWTADERTLQNARKHIEFSNYVAGITGSRWFHAGIMLTIFLDVVFSALETNHQVKLQLGCFFQVTDELFVAVYAIEFLLKVYVEPVHFWKNKNNVFDTGLLVVSLTPIFLDMSASSTMESLGVIRSCRSLRVIKVSSMPLVKVLLTALYRTVKIAGNVLILIFMLVFLFAVIGTQCFGDFDGGDPGPWGHLDRGIFTLFSIVTVDGWTDYQEGLDRQVLGNTRLFTIVFIVIGNFILISIYSALVLTEIDRSVDEFEGRQEAERLHLLALKKHAVGQRHKEELREQQKLKAGDASVFHRLMPVFKQSLCPDHLMVTEDPYSSLTFADVYLISLEDLDHSTWKLQRLYGNTAATLGKMEEKQENRGAVIEEEKEME